MTRLYTAKIVCHTCGDLVLGQVTAKGSEDIPPPSLVRKAEDKGRALLNADNAHANCHLKITFTWLLDSEPAKEVVKSLRMAGIEMVGNESDK